MTKLMMTSKCTSIAAHFEGLVDAPVHYKAHCLMRHVQGYHGSHWTPPLGNYSLRIAPAAARATANKTMTKTSTNFAGHFDGHGGARVGYRTHCPMKKVQGFTRRLWTPDTAIRQVLWPIVAIGNAYTCFLMFSIINLVEKGHRPMRRPLFSIGVWWHFNLMGMT